MSYLRQFFVAATHVLHDAAEYVSRVAESACRMPSAGFFAIGAAVVASMAIAGLCAAWALAIKAASRIRETRSDIALRSAQSDIQFRDALIDALPLSMVVFRCSPAETLYYGDGEFLFNQCCASSQRDKLWNCIDALRNAGQTFELLAVCTSGTVALKGVTVGCSAVIYLRTCGMKPTHDSDHGSVVIRRSPDAAEQPQASMGNRPLGDRAVDDHKASHPGTRAVLKGSLVFQYGGLAEILSKLTTAIAIFGPDRRLVVNNPAFARLWELEPAWLAQRPSAEDILDQLRQFERLPALRDYVAWKRDILRLFDEGFVAREELWHVQRDMSLKTTIVSYPTGGLSFLFEDLSETFRRQREQRSIADVQQATLDQLNDGVLVVGPDGCIKQHNRAFDRLWRLDRDFLEGHPRLTDVAVRCHAQFGREWAWEIVAAGIAAGDLEHINEWSKTVRSDGLPLFLKMARLPDGASLVIFASENPRMSQPVM